MRRLIITLATVVALSLPAVAGQEDAHLPPLFERLKAAHDAEEAAKIEQQIWGLWLKADIPEIDSLMLGGIASMNTGHLGEALRSFDLVVKLAPRHAEGWNKRATVYYLMGNFDASVRDIERTLALEPRHFGAISGLGLIYEAIGNDEAALKAFEKALTINPFLIQVRKNVNDLRKKLKGTPL